MIKFFPFEKNKIFFELNLLQHLYNMYLFQNQLSLLNIYLLLNILKKNLFYLLQFHLNLNHMVASYFLIHWGHDLQSSILQSSQIIKPIP